VSARNDLSAESIAGDVTAATVITTASSSRASSDATTVDNTSTTAVKEGVETTTSSQASEKTVTENLNQDASEANPDITSASSVNIPENDVSTTTPLAGGSINGGQTVEPILGADTSTARPILAVDMSTTGPTARPSLVTMDIQEKIPALR
jgi:hypothetical protein